MITPTVTSIALNGEISSEDLGKLITAIKSTNVLALPAGTALEDIQQLNIGVYDVPRDSGAAAAFGGSVRPPTTPLTAKKAK